MKCRVINETDFKISLKFLERCESVTLRKQGVKDNFSCSIVLVVPKKICKLNRDYHKKNSVTDVLTFESDEEDYRGEIVICPSFIKENSVADRFEWELCHAVVHGTLHLLGIHHEDEGERKKLHELEQKIIRQILTR